MRRTYPRSRNTVTEDLCGCWALRKSSNTNLVNCAFPLRKLVNRIPPFTAGHRTTHGELVVLVHLKRGSARSQSEDSLQSLSICENVLMKIKNIRTILSFRFQEDFIPTMSATWKQAARNVQMVLLFTLIKHQGHKFKIANLAQRVSNSNLLPMF